MLKPASLVCLVAGGILWILSPLGVELSALKFKTPDVFWGLFPASPALLLVGLVGLYLWGATEGGRTARIGLGAAILGSALIIAGAVGLYHFGVDDAYIMAAPAYRAFRAGLFLLAVGGLLFGAAGTRGGNFPTWAGLPFALSALAGLLAVIQDLGTFGAVLWAIFGAGWMWLGLAVLVGSPRRKRAESSPPPADDGRAEVTPGKGRPDLPR